MNALDGLLPLVKMNRPRPVSPKAYLRALVAVTMIAVWSLVVVSGFVVWLAPTGPRAGGWNLFVVELPSVCAVNSAHNSTRINQNSQPDLREATSDTTLF